MTFQKQALLPSSVMKLLDGAILSHKMGRSHSIHWTEQGFGEKHERKRLHEKKTGIQGSIILKQIFKKYDCKVRTGIIWLRPDASGGLL